MMVIAVSALTYGLLVADVHATGFNVVVSDFSMYYRWSAAWWDFSLRTPSHVPLYSMVLWAFRSLTFHLLDAATVMHAVALPFVAGAYVYVHRILRLHFPAAATSALPSSACIPSWDTVSLSPPPIRWRFSCSWPPRTIAWRRSGGGLPCVWPPARSVTRRYGPSWAYWPWMPFGARSAPSFGRWSPARPFWRFGGGDCARDKTGCGWCKAICTASLLRTRRCRSWMACSAHCCIPAAR